MSDFPGQWFSSGPNYLPGSIVSTLHAPVNFGATTVTTATNWPSADLAIYTPVVVPQRVTVVKLGWLNGTAVAGNCDAGLYSEDGTLLVSTGSTAQAGVSVIQSVDVADTVIGPGVFYLAVANSSTGRIAFISPGAAVLDLIGMAQQASAIPLPASATFAAATNSVLPIVIASLDTRVI